MPSSVRRSRFIISILFMIFLLPFVLAWLAFSRGMFLSHHTVNNGILLQNPPNILQLSLRDADDKPLLQKQLFGKWWLVNVCPQNDQDCQKNLYYIRQIRQATGKNRDRVNRGVVVFSKDALSSDFIEKLNSNYAGTVQMLSDKNLYMQILGNRNFKTLALSQSSLYLVDPHGNIILFYSKKIAPKKILKDLERLLRVSQIG